MWNEKSSSSATAASGEAIATTRSTIPSAKRPIRHPGTGCPRLASVRARMPYANATSTIGASWSGSSVQLVRSEGSSILRSG